MSEPTRVWLKERPMPEPIRVWRFEDAPEEFKFSQGGDEDWVAHVPAYLKEQYIGWMEDGGPFGCCRVKEHPLPDGSVLRIGMHA